MNLNDNIGKDDWAMSIPGEKCNEEKSNKINKTLVRKRIMGLCKPSKLKKKLPILTWLPHYNKDDLIGDFIAGVTVGLTVVPQGLAYAIIGGLPPNYGLYSAFLGLFIYVIFGPCKDVTIGPTALMSLLTYEYTKGDPEAANLLCLTTGIICILFGLFNLGFLIAFVPNTVICGFNSAAAITIVTSQINALFGVKSKGRGLINTWVQLIKHIEETRWQDLSLGVVSVVLLFLLKKMRDLPRFRKSPDDVGSQKALKMAVFLISVGRNAIVVIIATIISASLEDEQPFTITGMITPGLPLFGPPHLTLANGTISFMEAMENFGVGVIILPAIAILENVALASAFSQGKTVDATQEMIALGLCNIGNSFCQSMPITGSISRTAVNATSGVRTTAGGIVTGVMVILALAVLTPYFRHIPLSALAAVIICAALHMIDYEVIVPIWRARKLDQIVLWTSFLGAVFWKLEYGIILGILVNLVILLVVETNPKTVVNLKLKGKDLQPSHVVVIPRSGLMYINETNIRNRITKAGLEDASGALPVVVDCKHMSVVDYSASKGMKLLASDFGKRGQPLIFVNTSPGVKRSLLAVNPQAVIVEEEKLIATLSALTTKAKQEDLPIANGENTAAALHREPSPASLNGPSFVSIRL